MAEKPKYTLEQMFEIWEDSTGLCTEIGSDRDGLDLIEIRSKDEKGEIYARLSFTKDQARLVYQAIRQLIGEDYV